MSEDGRKIGAGPVVAFGQPVRQLLAKIVPALASSQAWNVATAHRQANHDQLDWVCPISQQSIRDLPVERLIWASDGQIYERAALQAYLVYALRTTRQWADSPVTRKPLFDETRAFVDGQAFVRLRRARILPDVAIVSAAAIAVSLGSASLGAVAWGLGAALLRRQSAAYGLAGLLAVSAAGVLVCGAVAAWMAEAFCVDAAKRRADETVAVALEGCPNAAAADA